MKRSKIASPELIQITSLFIFQEEELPSRVEITAEIFNGGQNKPQKPLSTGKIAALTALNRKNSGDNGVEPQK